jgi:PIN domain nuclease of toxin-antitoxin system
MIAALLDTHAFVWFITDEPRLSSQARRFIVDSLIEGNLLAVSAVSIVEIVYLAEKGKIPTDFIKEINRFFTGVSPFVIAPLDMSVLLMLDQVPRNSVPDMPDRIIVATALALGVPLVTQDQRIHQSGVVTVIW